MITSIIKISDFRVSVWNADSLVFVTELDFLDKVQSGESLPRGNVHTEISDIGLNNTHLAVQVFLTNPDWFLPGEGMENPRSQNITFFWSLDSSNPAVETLHYLTSLRKSLVEAEICETGFIHLNEKFFCRYLSGIFSDSSPKFSTKLQVFDLEDLEHTSPWIVNVNQSDVKDFEDCNEDSIKLEQGASHRVAVFNVYKSLFKILNIETGDVKLKIDLRNSNILGRRSFTAWQLYDSNWSFGRFLFLSEINNIQQLNKKTFQIIIVTPEENHREHLLDLPHFLIGNKLESGVEKQEMIIPSNRVHLDLTGAVIVTEEFILQAKF